MSLPIKTDDVASLARELFVRSFASEVENNKFNKWKGLSDTCFTAAESFFLSAQWDKENRSDANNH